MAFIISPKHSFPKMLAQLACIFLLFCAVNANPGTLSFTVDEQEAHGLALANVYLSGNECETKVFQNPFKFFINWANCKTEIKTAEILLEYEIRLNVASNDRVPVVVNFKKIPKDVLEQILIGGEAEILVRPNEEIKYRIRYLRDPTRQDITTILRNKPHILTFTLEYATNPERKFEYVRLVNYDYKCDLIYECVNSKFTMNLAECNIKDAEDLGRIEPVVYFTAHGQEMRRPIYFRKVQIKTREQLMNGGVAKMVFRSGIGYLEIIYGQSEASSSSSSAPQNNYVGPNKMLFTLQTTDAGMKFVSTAIEFDKKECKVEMLPDFPREPKRFFVDWVKCGLKSGDDFYRVTIRLKYTQHGVPLPDFIHNGFTYWDPELLQWFFDGGKAEITIMDNLLELQYVERYEPPPKTC